MTQILRSVRSADKTTTKHLLSTSTNESVECTYVGRPEKHIICFSTQVGCSVGCKFCVSGTNPSRRAIRSLTAVEMKAHVEHVASHHDCAHDNRPILFSAMGEGEPLLNYAEVVHVLHEVATLPKARLALSTSGVRPEAICKLSLERFRAPFKLQVSLHSAIDASRQRIIVASARVQTILDAVREFLQRSLYPVELNYLLLSDINDDDAHALALVSAVRGLQLTVKLNELNAAPSLRIHASSLARRARFFKLLSDHEVSVEHYKTNGAEIGAACGQLAYQTGNASFIHVKSA